MHRMRTFPWWGGAYIHSPTECLLSFFVEQFTAGSLAGDEFLFPTVALVGFMCQHVGGFQLSLVIDEGYIIAVTGVDDHRTVSGGCPVVVLVAKLFNGECGTVRLCDGHGHTQRRSSLDKDGYHTYCYQCNQFFHLVLFFRLQSYGKPRAIQNKFICFYCRDGVTSPS